MDSGTSCNSGSAVILSDLVLVGLDLPLRPFPGRFPFLVFCPGAFSGLPCVFVHAGPLVLNAHPSLLGWIRGQTLASVPVPAVSPFCAPSPNHCERLHLSARRLLLAGDTCISTVGKELLFLVTEHPGICPWEAVLRPVLPRRTGLQPPTAVDDTRFFIACLPPLVSLLHSLLIFIGITYQINHLQTDPSLKTWVNGRLLFEHPLTPAS